MATPEPVQSSRRLQRAASAERTRLRRELEQVRRAVELLRSRLTNEERLQLEIEQRLALIDQLTNEAEDVVGRVAEDNVVAFPDAATEPPHGYLRGATIRLVAVRLLAATAKPGESIHYGDWHDLLTKAGYGVSGRDPLASFLTQVTRSPVVVRADRPGHYLLDFEAPSRLHSRLDELNGELLGLHKGQQTIEAITSSRERRSELVSEISRVERALEEATEALGLPISET